MCHITRHPEILKNYEKIYSSAFSCPARHNWGVIDMVFGRFRRAMPLLKFVPLCPMAGLVTQWLGAGSPSPVIPKTLKMVFTDAQNNWFSVEKWRWPEQQCSYYSYPVLLAKCTEPRISVHRVTVC